MYTYHKASLAVVLVLSMTAGCGDEDESPSGPQVVEITDDLDTPTRWTYPNIYLIRDFDFWVNDTLTIEPGVVVKFHADEGPGLTLGGSGTLLASGTADRPIIFTSSKDDMHGGDTNRDGSATQPAPGDWGSIATNALNGSTFSYCQFLYGGAGSYLSTLDLDGSTATVSDCLFARNRGGRFGSFFYGALNARGAKTGTQIVRNTFYGNELPLSADVTFSLDDSNSFHDPANAAIVNRMNGVYVSPSGDFVQPISWQETEVAFVIDDNDLWIDTSGALTLGNNVVVKFTPDSTLLYPGSALNNHDGSGVAFTSFKDDTRKGDTNGDGPATTPADGDWEGIYNDTTGDYQQWSNIYFDSH